MALALISKTTGVGLKNGGLEPILGSSLLIALRCAESS